MNSTEIIAALQSHLDTQLSEEVQVTGGGGNRPVPAVLIENWDEQQIGPQEYVDSTLDENGYEDQRIYHTPYDLEIDFLIKAHDTLQASQLRESLKDVLEELQNDPSVLSDHLARVTVGEGGGVNYQFVNPTESEMQQTATFTAASVYLEDGTPITDVELEVQITD